MMTQYVTMKELGQVLDLTSHQIGKRLKALGLRTEEGKPSRTAFEGGYCSQKWTADGNHYLWAWDKEKTLKALVGEGTTPRPPALAPEPR